MINITVYPREPSVPPETITGDTLSRIELFKQQHPNSSFCAIIHYYYLRENKIILCELCIVKYIEIITTYQDVLQHWNVIGKPQRKIKCTGCGKNLIILKPLTSCETCHAELAYALNKAPVSLFKEHLKNPPLLGKLLEIRRKNVLNTFKK